MYNAAQKEQFIREYSTKTGVRATARQVFENLSRFEEEYGVDLCRMDDEMLGKIFRQNGRVRAFSSYTPAVVLRAYSEWCRRNNIEGATDAAMRIDQDDTEQLRHLTLRNPRHLQTFLDAICLPESEQTSDNVFRSYYWLAYAGIGDRDILTVTKDEVRFDTMTVFHGGREYPLYREALPAVRNCVELESFRYFHPNYANPIWRERVPGDILLRGVRCVPSLATMRVDLKKRTDAAVAEGKTDLQLSYYKIWISGVFYRMYEDELAGFPPDFSGFVDDKLGDFRYKLSPGGNSQEYKRKAAADSYLADYERWKTTLIV